MEKRVAEQSHSLVEAEVIANSHLGLQRARNTFISDFGF